MKKKKANAAPPVDTKVSAALVLTSLQVDAKPHFAKLKKLAIADKQSYEIAAQKVAALKALAKVAREKQASLIEPLQKVIEDIKELFAPFLDKVTEAELAAKDDMVKFLDQLDKQKEKVATAIETGKIAKLSTAANKLAELEIISGASSVRKVWELVEIDGNVTPREYLVPDRKKISIALKDGKQVLGWKLERKKSIAI